MDRKHQLALAVVLALGFGLLILTALVGNRLGGLPGEGDLSGLVWPSESSDGDPVEAPVSDTTSLAFERTVQINELVELEVMFRDYAQLPADFVDYEAAVASLPALPGSVSFTFKSYNEAERLGPLSAEPGSRFVYVTYELLGHPDNPSGERVVPNQPFSGKPDLAPQAVLALGADTLPVKSVDFNVLMNVVGLDHPTHLDFDEPQARLYGGVWQRPINRLPIVALEYQHADGGRRLIKLDY